MIKRGERSYKFSFLLMIIVSFFAIFFLSSLDRLIAFSSQPIMDGGEEGCVSCSSDSDCGTCGSGECVGYFKCINNCCNYSSCTSDNKKCCVDEKNKGICLVGICTSQSFCGNSEDSDGDNINERGTAIDRYCEKGECKEKSYTDYCSGICSRSELVEYYVENDRVKNKRYLDLFSTNRYCKNGKVYIDSNNPSVSIYPISSGWRRDNIRVSISCSDGDESGCYKYNYNLIKIV